METLFAAVLFIIVHSPGDHQEVQLNASEISSIRKPRDADGHFADGTNCLLTMTNGKFFATEETCLEVIHQISEVSKREEH
jgi:uncharacterized protein YlzI (FlbEa/FlbD family)